MFRDLLDNLPADAWSWGRAAEKRRHRAVWRTEALEIRTVPAIAVNLEGDWSFNGRATHVDQNGDNLVLTNEAGGQTAGRLVSNTEIHLTGWGGMTAILQGNQIVFSNNSVWTRTSAPDLSGSWTFNGQGAYIDQTGDSVTLINEFGARSGAQFFNNNTQIRATDWGGLVGTLTGINTHITWSNGASWYKDNSINPPDLGGTWLFNGQGSSIQQTGLQLTFTNEFGAPSSGSFISDTQIRAEDWNLTGTIVGNEIRWSNGAVWLKGVTGLQVNLAGTWQFNGQFTQIQQTGNNLLLTNENGEQSQAVFASAAQIQATDWGNLVGHISSDGARISWSNGSTWTRFA
jgi:hypothetical protein